MSKNDGLRVPRLLTVKELARQTGLQPWRIYALIREGQGPPHLPVGRTYRFPEDGVLAWVREQTNISQKENAE
jgi:excisionase family DNA binding protein